MSPIGMLVIGAIIGLIVGVGIAAWLFKRSGNPNSPKALQQELDNYREEVVDHFAETAALVNEMTDSYKAVFDHLQTGADKLIDPEALREKLTDQSGDTITLNRLGYAVGGAPVTAATGDTPTAEDDANVDQEDQAAASEDPPAQSVSDSDASADATANAEQSEAVDNEDDLTPPQPPTAAHS